MKRASLAVTVAMSFVPWVAGANGIPAVPKPVPKPGEVLVQVAAAGVSPADVLLSQSGQGAATFPAIAANDIAGRVVATGAGVDPVLLAKDVFALIPSRGVGYAEYVAVPADLVVPKPPRLSYAQAAAVPLSALTAYQ